MKRTLIASALFAGTMLSAGSLDAQVSKNSGFLLNLHLAGNSIESKLNDAESERESGSGFGLGLGYGFGERFALVINLDAGTISSDEEDEPGLVLAHFDIGGRLNFGSTASALRPYVHAAFSGVAEGVSGEPGGEDVIFTGAGYTVGGGLQYFFSPRLALDAGLQGSFGEFTQIQEGDESAELDEGVEFTTARLQLGVTWHP